MAWNGSDQTAPVDAASRRVKGGSTNSSSTRRASASTGGRKSGIKHGLLALLLIAALGGAAVWYFTRPAPPPPPAQGTKHKAQSTIASVTPAPARTNRVAVVQKPKRVVEYRKVGKNSLMKYIDGKKAWQYPREDYHGPVYTSSVVRVDTIVEKTFKHEADRTIAELIMIDPGEMIVGEIEYDDGFVRDFLKSYEDPFTISPGDTEEQKALKHRVAEVKGELRQRMDQGEHVGKILTEARNQLQELGAYKEEMREMVENMARKEAKTAQDVEDCVAAANKMLESRGIEPIKVKGILRSQIRRLNEQKAHKGESNE